MPLFDTRAGAVKSCQGRLRLVYQFEPSFYFPFLFFVPPSLRFPSPTNFFFCEKSATFFFRWRPKPRSEAATASKKKAEFFSLSLAGEPFILGNLACVRGVCELVRGCACECVWECAPLPPTFFPTSSLASLFLERRRRRRCCCRRCRWSRQTTAPSLTKVQPLRTRQKRKTAKETHKKKNRKMENDKRN